MTTLKIAFNRNARLSTRKYSTIMSSATNTAGTTSSIPQADLESFTKHLKNSDRILALCGAGLSAASGLPTFRGVGGLWRSYDATSLATPSAFSDNPGLVWQFYSYRRHMALGVQPNPAHYALAELSRRKPGFLTLSQNVDGGPRSISRAHSLHSLSFLRSEPTSRSSILTVAPSPRFAIRRQMHFLLLQAL